MRRNRLKSLDKGKLRRGLTVFFLCLAIPTAVLVQQSYSRLKWETFHQHQVLADELAGRINNQLIRWINVEEQRPFTDYAFLNVAGSPSANFIQRSPLTAYPVQSDIPGLLGFFQVNAAGNLSTPLVPPDLADKNKVSKYGIVESELSARLALQQNIEQILQANRLLSRRQDNPAEKKPDNSYEMGLSKAEEVHPSTSSGRTVLNSKANEEKADNVAGVKAYPSADSKVINNMERDAKASSKLYAQQENSAANAPPIAEPEGQAVFDELKKTLPSRSKQENKLGKLQDIPLSKSYNAEPAQAKSAVKTKAAPIRAQTANRKEQTVLAEVPASAKPAAPSPVQDKARITQEQPAKPSDIRIRTFESVVDPFEFSQLDSGHFVLYRKVWLDGQRYIQGMLINQNAFLQGAVNTAFQETALAQMSDLLVVLQDNVLSAFSGRSPRGYLSSRQELQGELLFQAQLSDPFSDLQLVFSITRLPVGPGGWVIIWLSLVLALVLLVGFFALYKLGVRQINLVNLQQDFVSAVSHELKTPLTSIRMYGEMLQAGWVEEAKKKSYYDFILDESERLTRLINNVLQLAKMTRNNLQPDLKSLTVAELMDGIQSKVSTQIKSAGFELKLSCGQAASQAKIKVNPDWLIQIMINLVDNAIKFSAKADIKVIELSCDFLGNGHIQFKVRDYGPGVAKHQMKKIFKLFYRTENELTRETVGTGIGLALAQQMTMAMKGKIDMVNVKPGAEFGVVFALEK